MAEKSLVQGQSADIDINSIPLRGTYLELDAKLNTKKIKKTIFFKC